MSKFSIAQACIVSLNMHYQDITCTVTHNFGMIWLKNVKLYVPHEFNVNYENVRASEH